MGVARPQTMATSSSQVAGPSKTSYAGEVASRARAAPEAPSPFRLITKQLGVKCYAHPDMSIEACVRAMAGVVGPSAIVAASKMYGKAVFFLKAERAVHLALEKGLTVSVTFLAVDPLEATAHRILLSNVPPYVPAELLRPHLHLLGEVRSGVTPIPLGLRDVPFRHIYSFRRQAFVRLAREECLEGGFNVLYQGETHRVFWSADGVRCHACKEVGHVKKNCPASKAAEPTTKAAAASAETPSSPTETPTAPPSGEATPVAASTSAAGREEEASAAGQKTRPEKKKGAKNPKTPKTTKGKTAPKTAGSGNNPISAPPPSSGPVGTSAPSAGPGIVCPSRVPESGGGCAAPSQGRILM